MKLSKKVIALVLSAVLALSMAACGGNDASSSEVPSQASSSEASSEAPAESSSEASSETSSEASSEASSEEASSEAPAGEPLTEEEYTAQMKAAFANMQTAVSSVQELDTDSMDSEELAQSMAPVIESLKAVGNLQAPEKYAEGQASYKKGTDKMAEYFEYLIEISKMDDADFTPEKQQEFMTTMMTMMTEASTALNEGTELLKAAGLDMSTVLVSSSAA